MDFAGWFEAYLGGTWYTFDARNNTPRIGRILIARGRDACRRRHHDHLRTQYAGAFKVWADESLVEVSAHACEAWRRGTLAR